MSPFARTGGLANVVDDLTSAIAKRGHDVRVVIPRHRQISNQLFPTKHVGDFTVVGGERAHPATVLRYADSQQVQVYYIQSPLFDREGIYGESDDALRWIFFSRAVLESLNLFDWTPDVIHCHDYPTGLVPVFLRHLYSEELGNTASVFTVHNAGFQGIFSREPLESAGLDPRLFTRDLEFYGRVNTTKAGVIFSDIVTTVSEGYAQDLLTPDFGYGLEGVFQERGNRLVGILNGIDGQKWNPETDPLIPYHYSASNLADKRRDKTALLEEFGLEATGRRRLPLIGIVSRIDANKGFDILLPTLGELASVAQVVLQGTGDRDMQERIAEEGRKHPGMIGTEFGLDASLAHRILAGADFLLIPSKYEPCGVVQMQALRYGTIPIAALNGGLADTVQEFDSKTGEGNGFAIREPSPSTLREAVDRATRAYRGHQWKVVVQNAMKSGERLTWDFTAGRYEEVYRRAVKLRAEEMSD